VVGSSERSIVVRSRRARAGGARSHETGEARVLMGGPGALYRGLNRFKLSKSIQIRSNLFQIILNLIPSKRVFPISKI
jgi:hypothetical protein